MTKPKSQQGKGAAPQAQPQTRLSFGKDRRLALMLGQLVTMLSAANIATLLTPEQTAQVQTAKAAADEVGSNVMQPIIDRIGIIKTELTALITGEGTPDAAKLKELSLELDRLTKRKAQIDEILSQGLKK